MSVSIALIAQTFLANLSFGTFIFNPLSNPKKTGGGFQKVITALSFAGLLIVMALQLLNGNNLSLWLPYVLIGLVLLSFNYFYYVKQDGRGPMALFINIILILGSFFYHYAVNDLATTLYHFTNLCFLGIVNFSMLLGHWYLVTPKMSVQPLLNCCFVIWPLGVLKLISGLIVLSQTEQFNYLWSDDALWPTGASFDVIVLVTRYLVGLGGILLASIFAYKLTKMRDTQAATGVFYVMVILALLGELSAYYFYYTYGLML